MSTQPTYEPTDLSLKTIYLKGRSIVSILWKQKKLPILLALLGGAIALTIYYTTKPVYPASLTFSVDEDEAGAGAGLTSILGQFGFGSVKPSRFNLDKILALTKSRRVIEQSLFSNIEINGDVDYIANHIWKLYELELPGKLKDVRFTHDSIPAFTAQENQMLLGVFGTIVGPRNNPKKALLMADYNEDSNIMSLQVVTKNPRLSFELVNHLYTALSEYYTQKSVEKQRRTLEIVTAKRDSVLAALKGSEYQLANFRDRNQGLYLLTDKVSELRIQRDIAALSGLYAEVIKNVEVADFSLRNKTPFIQVIDSPLEPIGPAPRSLPKRLVLGLFLGGLIGCLIVLGKTFLKEINP